MRDRLVIYAPPRLPIEECAWLAERDGALIVSGRTACEKTRTLRRQFRHDGTLWIDPAEYATWPPPAKRVPRQDDGGLFTMPPPHAAAQTAEFFTPSGIIFSHRRRLLRETLETDYPGVSRPIRVVLPLDTWWLRDGLQVLLKEVGAVDRPIAVVLRTGGDPLDTEGTVTGLVRLIRSHDVYLLRADNSGIGAIAVGAGLAAVGTSSATRRLFARTDGPPPPSEGGTPVFVPALNRWLSGSDLQTLAPFGSARLGNIDACECPTCEGRSLLRFADPYPQRDDARHHDLFVLDEIATGILSGDDALSRWIYLCQSALYEHEVIAHNCQVQLRTGTLEQWASVESFPAYKKSR